MSAGKAQPVSKTEKAPDNLSKLCPGKSSRTLQGRRHRDAVVATVMIRPATLAHLHWSNRTIYNYRLLLCADET